MQAGSDSLLTSATFIKLAKTFFAGVESMDSHRDVLYGLGLVRLIAAQQNDHLDVLQAGKAMQAFMPATQPTF